jgi:hypothetical protein
LRRLERWFYTDWLRQREERRQRLQGKQSSAAANDEYDALPDASEGDLLKPAAETLTPRFLSLDNPIVATAALLALSGALAALSHR